VTGRVDTTGTDPAVADCLGAIADARAASDALAALPATRELGSVTVRPDDYYELDATGGGVFHFTSLYLQSGKTRDQGFSECTNEADFTVYCNDGDSVILNVDRLRVEACAYVTFDCGYRGDNHILNVPGRGPAILIGPESDISSAKLLAPQRQLKVNGA